MRRTRSTPLVLSLALLHPAQAVAGWELRHSTPSADFYVDKATLSPSGPHWKIWALSNLPAPNPHGTASLRILGEYDCRESRHRILQIHTYAGPMGTGKLLSSNETPDGWTTVSPGTSFAAVLRLVCRSQ